MNIFTNICDMLAFDPFQKCRDSAVSNKVLYPTFARTIPSTYKVSKSVISLVAHYKWKRFTVVVGNCANWLEAASTLQVRPCRLAADMSPACRLAVGIRSMTKTYIPMFVYICPNGKSSGSSITFCPVKKKLLSNFDKFKILKDDVCISKNKIPSGANMHWLFFSIFGFVFTRTISRHKLFHQKLKNISVTMIWNCLMYRYTRIV